MDKILEKELQGDFDYLTSKRDLALKSFNESMELGLVIEDRKFKTLMRIQKQWSLIRDALHVFQVTKGLNK